MARRRPAFKRTASKQYGWATIATTLTLGGITDIGSEILVAGDSDIEVRAIGNTHGNLKRIVGDITWNPWVIATTTLLTTPVVAVSHLYWAIMAVDNDDDASSYSPASPTTLAEERILAHGILSATFLVNHFGGDAFTTDLIGDTHVHVDVRSNRRIRSDDDIVLNTIVLGSQPIAEANSVGTLGISFRSLLKFPG